MAFTHKTEEYYRNFIELQEKLRKSEEERLKLEMKFNEMMRITREEEQMHYRKLRAQYKQFMEEDRRRQDRNERLLRTLERVESRIAALMAKSERFKLLRKQYHKYLERIYNGKMDIKIEDHSTNNKTTKTDNVDESDDILKNYLETLSSQKVKDLLLNKEVHKGEPKKERLPFSMVQDSYEDFNKYNKDDDKIGDNEIYKPNYANSIADDIINSIYSKQRVRKHDRNENVSDVDSSITSEENDIDIMKRSTADDTKITTFNHVDSPQIYNIVKTSTIEDAKTTRFDHVIRDIRDDLEKIAITKDNLEEANNNTFVKVINDDIQQKDSQDLEESPDLNSQEVIKNQQLADNEKTTTIDAKHGQETNVAKIEDENDLKDVEIQNKEPIQDSSSKDQESDALQQFNDDSIKQIEHSAISEEYKAEIHMQQNQHYVEGDNNDHHEQLLQQDDGTKEPLEMQNQEYQQYDADGYPVQQYNENGYPITQYDENGQPIQVEDQQYDQRGYPVLQYDENGQPVQYQYDENGQLIEQQYDHNGQPIVRQYEEHGQPIQAEYDKSDQLIKEYDQDSELIQNQYDENGQLVQQYDKNSQLIHQQYDEHGQFIQPEYDENGQLIQEYGQDQFDENGQLIQPHYDENGQIIQQYGQDGSLIQDQFDENGHLIQPHYDENGQLIQQYDQHGQLIQHHYDENGQLIQYQYDETGQLIQQFDQNYQYDPSQQYYQENNQYYDDNQQYADDSTSVEHDMPTNNNNASSISAKSTELSNLKQIKQEDDANEAEIKDDAGETSDHLPQFLDKDNNNVKNDDGGGEDKQNLETKSANNNVNVSNVMEMLDTDTESAKQDTNKVSNESDFDFSNG